MKKESQWGLSGAESEETDTWKVHPKGLEATT
jgi:hypothetical protein